MPVRVAFLAAVLGIVPMGGCMSGEGEDGVRDGVDAAGMPDFADFGGIDDDVGAGGEVLCLPDAAAGLVATPDPIAFGTVECGASRDLVVRILNTGCRPVSITSAFLDLEGSTGFTMESVTLPEEASLPLVLGGGESLDVVLRFTPTLAGEVRTSLIVSGEGGLWPFGVLGVSGGCPSIE